MRYEPPRKQRLTMTGIGKSTFRPLSSVTAIGNGPANFNDLFRFNGTNLDKMNYFIGAWSSVTCAPEEEGVPPSACLEVTE